MSRLTPCDIKDDNGEYNCPFTDVYGGPESSMCRDCCGCGADDDPYPDEPYEGSEEA